MFNSTLCLVLTGLLWLGWLLPSETCADYYKYTDSKGVVHITNKLDAVPRKYRSMMQVEREAPKKETAAAVPVLEPGVTGAASAPGHEDAAAASPRTAGRFSELSSRFVWLKPLVYVAGILALFFVVIKVTALLSSPMLSRVIHVSFFLGVMVFLYNAYVEHLVRSTAKIKESAVAIVKKSSAGQHAAPAAE